MSRTRRRTPILLVAAATFALCATTARAHDEAGSTTFDLQVPGGPLGGALLQVLLIGPEAGSEVLHATWNLTFSSPPGGTLASDVLLELSVQLEGGGVDWVVSGADLGWPAANGTFSGSLGSDLLNGVLAPGLGGISTPELFLWSQQGGVTGQYIASTIELELAGEFCQTDLGSGGPGQVRLGICGEPLGSGQSAVLQLRGAQPLAPMMLLFGASANPTGFKGGVLLPIPIAFGIPLTTGVDGGLAVTIPGGGGPLGVVLQAIVADATLPAGVAISNALQVELLP